MNERDPRTNPQPGDRVYRKVPAGILTRQVVSVKGNEIAYFDNDGRLENCEILSWLYWCRTATVQTIAETNPPAEKANP